MGDIRNNTVSPDLFTTANASEIDEENTFPTFDADTQLPGNSRSMSLGRQDSGSEGNTGGGTDFFKLLASGFSAVLPAVATLIGGPVGTIVGGFFGKVLGGLFGGEKSTNT